MQSSSGVSSTGSIPYGSSLVGELDLLEMDGEGLQHQIYQQIVLKEFSSICHTSFASRLPFCLSVHLNSNILTE
jgi:hypothetical protein